MSTKNEIWLTFNNDTEKIHFPVNPEKITVTCNGKIESVNVVDLGEILVKQGRPAIQISWKSFLPSSYFPGMNFQTVYDPYWVSKRIQTWMEGDGPCRLTITGTPIDMYVLIKTYKLEEEGGDVGTVYYNIAFSEFRTIAPRKLNPSANGTVTISDEQQRVDDRATPTTYTVASGDSLYLIAKRIWGDGGRWREIYNANTDKIKNPNRIYAGQILTIPG